MIKIIPDRRLFRGSDEGFELFRTQLLRDATGYERDLPSLERVLLIDSMYGSYVILGIFNRNPTELERDRFATSCTEMLSSVMKDSSAERFVIKIYSPGIIAGLDWSSGKSPENLDSYSEAILRRFRERSRYTGEIVETIVERKLYSNCDDRTYIGIVSVLQGFTNSYEDEAPHLEKVLIMDTEIGKYIFLGMFSKKPTEEEAESFSCLCTELMTYESDMSGVDNLAEKIYFPDIVTDMYSENPLPGEVGVTTTD